MPRIEDRQLRSETGIKPEVPLELREINERGMEDWLGTYERTPDGFSGLSEELSKEGADAETVKKWQWLLVKKIEHIVRESPQINQESVRFVERHGVSRDVLQGDQERLQKKHAEYLARIRGTDVEFVEKLLFTSDEQSSFDLFCERNPQEAFKLTLNLLAYFQNIVPKNFSDTAYPGTRCRDFQCFTKDDARRLQKAGRPSSTDSHDEFLRKVAERARYFDFIPQVEAVLVKMAEKNAELTPSQAQEFCDQALPFLLARGPYQHLDAYAKVMEKIPDAAAANLMKKLHDLTVTEIPLEDFPELERQRYVLIGLLRHIELPAKEKEDGRFNFLGRNIELDRFSDETDYVERLSSYGEVGVFNAQDKILGYFSMHELKAAGLEAATAEVKDFNADELFFPCTNAEISGQDQKSAVQAYKNSYGEYAKSCTATCAVPFHTLTLREQLIFIHFNLSDSEHLLRLRAWANGNPSIIRSILFVCLYNKEHTNDTPLVHSSHGLRNLKQDHKCSPNIYDRCEKGYAWPDPVDMTLTYVDQAKSRALQLAEQMQARFPDLNFDFRSLVRGLELHEANAFEAYTYESPEYFVRAQLRAYQDLSWGLAAFEELAGLAKRESIDLEHYLKQQQALEGLMSESPEFKRVVIQAMVYTGTLKPKPYLSWTVDRKAAGTSQEKVSGNPEADTYEARLGAPVFPWLQKMIDAKTTTEPLVIFEPGVGSGAFREAVKKEFGDQIIIVGIADAIYYNPGTYIKNLIDFDRLGVDLNEAEQNQVGEILYKMIAVADGSHHLECIAYDSARLDAITRDPTAIINLVVNQLPRLFSTIKAVPDTVCAIDASSGKPETIYPYHLVISDDHTTHEGDVIVSEKVRQTLKALQAQGRGAMAAGDPLVKMPIRAEGVIMGDFETIAKMVEIQFDLAIDARALVYKRGEEWVNIIEKLVRASKIGIWSDSERDNEGYRYRDEELKQLKTRLGAEYRIFVIQGPGFKREDFKEQKNVPLAVRIFPSNLYQESMMRDVKNYYEIT